MSTPVWETFHRRAQLLHTVIEHIERTGGSRLPWQDVPGLTEVFDTPHQLVLALYQWWETTLGSRIDQALEQDSHHQPASVTTAWAELARAYPGVRRVLDHSAADPALAEALHHEYRLLAVAAGLATTRDRYERAVAAGIDLIDHWRGALDHMSTPPTDHTPDKAAPRRRRSWWWRSAASSA